MPTEEVIDDDDDENQLCRRGCTASAFLLISQQWMLGIAPNFHRVFLRGSVICQYQYLHMFGKGATCPLRARGGVYEIFREQERGFREKKVGLRIWEGGLQNYFDLLRGVYEKFNFKWGGLRKFFFFLISTRYSPPIINVKSLKVVPKWTTHFGRKMDQYLWLI